VHSQEARGQLTEPLNGGVNGRPVNRNGALSPQGVRIDTERAVRAVTDGGEEESAVGGGVAPSHTDDERR